MFEINPHAVVLFVASLALVGIFVLKVVLVVRQVKKEQRGVLRQDE